MIPRFVQTAEAALGTSKFVKGACLTSLMANRSTDLQRINQVVFGSLVVA